jgi:isocitrate/isopropylmalate dehydrogenase
LVGKDVANPLAMILAGAALLTHGDTTMQRAGNAIRKACLSAIHDGVRTADLGGESGTTEFADAVIARVRELLSL